MISIKEALSIRDGDRVHDYYGRYLEVKSYSIAYEKGLPTHIEFGCRDINTNEQFRYSHEEIYLSFDDLGDEDKLFLKWLRNNTNCYYSYYDDVKLLRHVFMSGFSDGFSYKQKYLAEQQLQK